MAIDRATGQTKHIITEHNHLVGNRLMAATYCGWNYIDGRMEGAYAYGGWWNNPDIPNRCQHCVHTAACQALDPATCQGCAAVDAETTHPINR